MLLVNVVLYLKKIVLDRRLILKYHNVSRITTNPVSRFYIYAATFELDNSDRKRAFGGFRVLSLFCLISTLCHSSFAIILGGGGGGELVDLL